jgi:hypothetical protein
VGEGVLLNDLDSKLYITEDLSTLNDLEGSSHVRAEVPSQQFLGRTEETHENPQSEYLVSSARVKQSTSLSHRYLG